MKIMFLGTSSNAGKTTIAAVFCKYLHNKGYNAAPFKGSNLSLNSYATSDGKEIGMGQAFQAVASGLEPSADMNPILLKPSGGKIQLILNGRPYPNHERPSHDRLMYEVCSAFERLEDSYDAIVCEGSGSPVELNLMTNDLANLNLVRKERIPSIIIGDIERGGVFAAIYGTWELIPEQDRRYLKGYIINRFRGEPAILKKGIDLLKSLTGMDCIGVIPYMDLKFPEEDSMASRKGRLAGDDLQKAYLDNIDEFIEISEESMDYEKLIEISMLRIE